MRQMETKKDAGEKVQTEEGAWDGVGRTGKAKFETCIVLHACVGLLEGVCHSGTLSWGDKRRKRQVSQPEENGFQSSTGRCWCWGRTTHDASCTFHSAFVPSLLLLGRKMALCWQPGYMLHSPPRRAAIQCMSSVSSDL